MKHLQTRLAVTLSLSAGAALCTLIATSTQAAPARGNRPIANASPSANGSTTRVRPTPKANATARPTPGARPTPSANATARPTPAPRPAPPARDIPLLEGALERTLTATEKTAISTAARARDTAAKAAVATFETGVAELFDLNSSQLQGRINEFCRGRRDANRLDLPAVLAGVLGRELTDSEIAALATLTEARAAAIQLAVKPTAKAWPMH